MKITNHSASEPQPIEHEFRHELELYPSSKLGGAFTVAIDEYLTLLYANENYYNILFAELRALVVDDDIQKSKTAGMNAYLAKPIESKLLFQTLFDFIYGRTEEISE